jgi:hypothetical protein
MTDYAVNPFQPIAQGVVTFPDGIAPGSVIEFDGEGISFIERVVGFPNGAYLLTLDEGLPGNAGAVPPGVAPINDPDVRTVVTTRGSGVPPISPIATIAVLYPNSPVPGVGADQILIVMQNTAPILADPPAGFELIVWRVE